MTPLQMRARARRSLENASVLLSRGDADAAAYDAGHAAELILKARYCTRAGLDVLPDNIRELRAHKLNDHDLKNLLKLTDNIFVDSGSLESIDWASIASWDNQDRYTALGTTTPALAEARIDQTWKLYWELVQYEVVERMQGVQPELERVAGPLHVYAIAQPADAQAFELHLVTDYFDEASTRAQRVDEIWKLFIAALPEDLRCIQKIHCWGCADPTPVSFYYLARVAAMEGHQQVRNCLVMSGGEVPQPRDEVPESIVMGRSLLLDGIRYERIFVVRAEPPRTLFEKPQSAEQQ